MCGLAVGDYFELTHSSHLTIPAGRHFCIYALAAVLPLLPPSNERSADDDWLGAGLTGLLPRPGRTPGHEDRPAPAASTLDGAELT